MLGCLLVAFVHHPKSVYGITPSTFVRPGGISPRLEPKTSNQNLDGLEPRLMNGRSLVVCGLTKPLSQTRIRRSRRYRVSKDSSIAPNSEQVPE